MTLKSATFTPGNKLAVLDTFGHKPPPPPDYWATLERPGHKRSPPAPAGRQVIVYTPPKCCYVIVTARSLLWSVLTLLASGLVGVSIVTPQWLLGRPRWVGLRSANMSTSAESLASRTYRPSLGLFNRCIKVSSRDGPVDNCHTFVTGLDQSSEDFPDAWKSALILFTLAVALLGFTNITAIFSICIQSIFRKSIYTVSGLLQAIAGLFLIVGEMLYPAAWGARRVRNICGERAAPFMLDDCTFGWAFYSMLGGTLLVFLCAVLSIQAENATSSDRVEKQVMEGKTVICVPA